MIVVHLGFGVAADRVAPGVAVVAFSDSALSFFIPAPIGPSEGFGSMLHKALGRLWRKLGSLAPRWAAVVFSTRTENRTDTGGRGRKPRPIARRERPARASRERMRGMLLKLWTPR